MSCTRKERGRICSLSLSNMHRKTLIVSEHIIDCLGKNSGDWYIEYVKECDKQMSVPLPEVITMGMNS